MATRCDNVPTVAATLRLTEGLNTKQLHLLTACANTQHHTEKPLKHPPTHNMKAGAGKPGFILCRLQHPVGMP